MKTTTLQDRVYLEHKELGDQIWIQNRSDWPQMGQIRDFFRSDFSTFWRPRAKMYWNLIWKSPGFVPFGANLTHFASKFGHPGMRSSHWRLTKYTVHYTASLPLPFRLFFDLFIFVKVCSHIKGTERWECGIYVELFDISSQQFVLWYTHLAHWRMHVRNRWADQGW